MFLVLCAVDEEIPQNEFKTQEQVQDQNINVQDQPNSKNTEMSFDEKKYR
jgi:hypothetical protein